ncbi:hypothetical protein NC651_000363, partial [Populus alba x Populus x berolinensis]
PVNLFSWQNHNPALQEVKHAADLKRDLIHKENKNTLSHNRSRQQLTESEKVRLSKPNRVRIRASQGMEAQFPGKRRHVLTS